MSRRIRDHLRSNVVGYVAVFIALSGTAFAVDGPLPGVNQVGSEDIINGEVQTPDLGPNSVATGKIVNDGVKAPDLADDLIADDTLNPLTGSTKVASGAIKEDELGASSVFGAEVAPGSLDGSDIADGSLHGGDLADGSIGAADLGAGSVGSAEVAANSLTGGDVDESTFSGLDAHDAFDAGCDPSAEVFIDCGSLTFTAGHPMQVLTTFTYGFSTANGDPFGACDTTLDGVHTSFTRSFSEEDNPNLELGGAAVVDVISVNPGSHTVGFECEELNPDRHDIEYRDIRIAALELAMD
jgi:hypothetical protein